MDKIIDSDNLQIDENNDLLERIQEAIDLQTEEVRSIEEALKKIEETNLPAMNDVLLGAIGADGGYMRELLININKQQSNLAAALRGQTIDQAEAQLKSGTLSESEFTDLAKKLGYGWDDVNGVVTTQDSSFKAHYKGWTAKSNNDVQTSTAENGVQVTGNGAPQASSNSGSSSGASSSSGSGGKSLDTIADEVIAGKWGTGTDRKNRLTAAGYDYSAVQRLVNQKMSGRSSGGGSKGSSSSSNSALSLLGSMASTAGNALGKIAGTVGSAIGNAFKNTFHFDQGGLANGVGLMTKDTIEPERVLSPRQTKAFENLTKNLTTNPVLNALTKVPTVQSKFGELTGSSDSSKKYYFSNFTIQANDIEQFINSIETIMPMKK